MEKLVIQNFLKSIEITILWGNTAKGGFIAWKKKTKLKKEKKEAKSIF